MLSLVSVLLSGSSRPEMLNRWRSLFYTSCHLKSPNHPNYFAFATDPENAARPYELLDSRVVINYIGTMIAAPFVNQDAEHTPLWGAYYRGVDILKPLERRVTSEEIVEGAYPGEYDFAAHRLTEEIPGTNFDSVIARRVISSGEDPNCTAAEWRAYVLSQESSGSNTPVEEGAIPTRKYR